MNGRYTLTEDIDICYQDGIPKKLIATSEKYPSHAEIQKAIARRPHRKSISYSNWKRVDTKHRSYWEAYITSSLTVYR